MNYFGSANAMQAALGFADKVTTVSPTYAEEIKLVEYGYGLDGSFRHISNKLVGILNGIDTEQWDPATDPSIAERYDQDSLSQKASNKNALCERFSLDATKPLLGVVSRLVDQKGIDFMLESIPGLLGQGWNVVILGAGESWMENSVRTYAANHPGRVAAFIGYDEALAHLIYAGVDTLAIPSRFEPCGLTQMIAMRYGTLPIARNTGGLHDSIVHDQTGFLFDAANSEGLLWASGVAKGVYDQPRLWKERQILAMQQDFSWERSAKQYEALYEEVIQTR
jgi:starch synthase